MRQKYITQKLFNKKVSPLIDTENEHVINGVKYTVCNIFKRTCTTNDTILNRANRAVDIGNQHLINYFESATISPVEYACQSCSATTHGKGACMKI